jgi:hypothetical protein
MKNLAVEFIVQRLAEKGILHSSDICEAKEMQKQNIIEARTTAPLLPSIDKSIYLNEAEHYYNETFKSE